MKMLVAVDGSEYSVKAAKHVAATLQWYRETPEIFLFHVQVPITTENAKRVLGSDVVDNYYREEAKAALLPAETVLREAGVPFHSTYAVGQITNEIRACIEKNGIDMLVMGSHGQGALQNLVMGSVATKVLATTSVPVLIIR